MVQLVSCQCVRNLNYPDLYKYWPRSSVDRASVVPFRRSRVQTPPRSNFVGTPKFPLTRLSTQGIWCIGSIAYFRHQKYTEKKLSFQPMCLGFSSRPVQYVGGVCSWFSPRVFLPVLRFSSLHEINICKLQIDQNRGPAL